MNNYPVAIKILGNASKNAEICLDPHDLDWTPKKKPFSLTVTVTNRKKPLLDGGLDNRRLE